MSSVVFVLLLATITVFILKMIGTSKDTQNGHAQTHTIQDPKTLLSGYTAADTMTAFATGYQPVAVGMDGAPVYYQSKDQAFVVQVESTSAITYSVPAHHTDDTATIKAQVATYMKVRGLKSTTSPTGSQNVTSRVTYTDKTNVCQLYSVPPTQEFRGQYSFTCTTKKAIQAEYTVTQNLLAIYKKIDNTSLYITEADRSHNHTEGNKSLTIVTVTSDEGVARQLFAAIDNRWEFIVTLDEGTGDTNGKYSSSQKVKKALQNPKYGDFLAKNVG